jgi:hypothetical protein
MKGWRETFLSIKWLKITNEDVAYKKIMGYTIVGDLI